MEDKREKAREANRRYRQKLKEATITKQITEKNILSELNDIKKLLILNQNKTRKKFEI